jgi:hypothetical protein
VPPGARKVELDSKSPVGTGIVVDELEVPGEKGVRLAGIVVRRKEDTDHKAVVLYLQGARLSVPFNFVG